MDEKKDYNSTMRIEEGIRLVSSSFKIINDIQRNPYGTRKM